jgi:hypothetical protein
VYRALTDAGGVPILSPSIERVYRLMDQAGWGDEDYTSLLRFLKALRRGAATRS